MVAIKHVKLGPKLTCVAIILQMLKRSSKPSIGAKRQGKVERQATPEATPLQVSRPMWEGTGLPKIGLMKRALKAFFKFLCALTVAWVSAILYVPGPSAAIKSSFF